MLLPGTWTDVNITYVVEDPGIDGAVTAIEDSFDAWADASGIDFTFDGTASVNANIEASGPNNSNTVSWARLVGSWTNALAVTIIWVNDTDEDGLWDSGENIVEAFCHPRITDIKIPIQSASPRLLELMGRHPKVLEIERFLKTLRKNNKRLFLRTDLIIGFPTETQEELDFPGLPVSENQDIIPRLPLQ